MVKLDNLEPSDGWSDEKGCEVCPGCGIVYSGNGGYVGPVYTTDGMWYESVFDTEPSDGPFICPECYEEFLVEQRAERNESLGEYL